MKKLLSILLCIIMVACLTACGEIAEDVKGTESDAEIAESTGKLNESTDAYSGEKLGFQLEEPEEGEEVAVLHTTLGDVYIRFFEKAAPKAVENFKTHIKNGYYNGLIFHRVIEGFMIQGGDPEGNGTGGESIWGKSFEDEFDKKLVNITGSVAMANSGVNTNGSQFFINNPGSGATKNKYKSWQEMKEYYINYAAEYKAQFKEYYEANYPNWEQMFENSFYIQGGSPVYESISDEMWKFYYENGANMHLDGAYRMQGGHTVFAQVFKGMDVVEKISAVETDENNKPTTDVVITSAEIINYTK